MDALGIALLVVLFIGALIFLFSIKQVNQYERGVKFRLGKFLGQLSPGWRIVWPIFESWRRIDIRIKAVEVPHQEAITRDNVTAKIDAVIYYRVQDAVKSVLEVENFIYAMSQLAQTTMRNVVGETALDDLLSKRDQVAEKIKEIIDKSAKPWGILVESVALKDIILPDEMRRVIARQAEAERERRAIIIRAEGERAAAENIATAAERLARATGGLHVRTLQTLAEVAADKSNTVVFVTPLEALRALEGLIKKEDGDRKSVRNERG